MSTDATKAPKTDCLVTAPAPKCGIVMPISATDNCTEQHWAEVLSILKEVATEAGYDPRLVSEGTEAGLIHKRIVTNLYSDEIVICDVSETNRNVMFELGMRMVFDKPTVIVKDERTDYRFDVMPIEHVVYPRDLRYPKMIQFRRELKDKIIGTVDKFETDKEASSYLKAFGPIQVAKMETKVVPGDKLMLEALEEIRNDLRKLRSPLAFTPVVEFSEKRMFKMGSKMLNEIVSKVAQYMDGSLLSPNLVEKTLHLESFLSLPPDMEVAAGDKELVFSMARALLRQRRGTEE
jgi:hypothetical protein